MPSTDRKLELKAKTSMAQTASQADVYAKGLMQSVRSQVCVHTYTCSSQYGDAGRAKEVVKNSG
jgi:hypothetical protein